MPERPVRVIVYKRDGRAFFTAEWTDRESGRKKTRSTGHDRRREAERWASKLEAELNAGVEQVSRRTTWKEFRQRIERDFLPEKRPMSRVSYKTALNAVETTLDPLLVSGVTGEAIDRMKAALRARDVRDTTIASYLRMLKAMLRWGHKRRLLATLPTFDMPRNVKVAGGRPVTDAEFAEILKDVDDIVGKARADSWSYLIRGLWASGLRIGEAYALTWDDPTMPRVDLDRPKPLLFIPGEHQKNGKDSVSPIVPEFRDLLLETPPAERVGFVFKPASGVRPGRPKLDTVKRVVSDIGGEVMTAHDLRRTFCHRWSKRVLPQVLRVLARHADVATTLTYYVDTDAETTFDAVYEAVRDTVTVKTADTPPVDPAFAA